MIWLHIYHVTAIGLEANLESLKTCFSQVTILLNDLNQLYGELKLVSIRIKTVSVTQGRFDHCMLFAIYKEMTDKSSLIDIDNELVVI